MMANAKPRPGYYGHKPAPPVAEEHEPDPVKGAAAIAAVIRFTRDEVYKMARHAERCPGDPAALPVRKVPGSGLVGDRRELLQWYDRVIRGRSAA